MTKRWVPVGFAEGALFVVDATVGLLAVEGQSQVLARVGYADEVLLAAVDHDLAVCQVLDAQPPSRPYGPDKDFRVPT